jgi:hypothetical protein
MGMVGVIIAVVLIAALGYDFYKQYKAAKKPLEAAQKVEADVVAEVKAVEAVVETAAPKVEAAVAEVKAEAEVVVAKVKKAAPKAKAAAKKVEAEAEAAVEKVEEIVKKVRAPLKPKLNVAK